MSITDVEIMHYTEKSIVVRGQTRLHKDALKALGGKFGSSFTDPDTGEKFPGWLFPRSKCSVVQEWVDGDRSSNVDCLKVYQKKPSVPESDGALFPNDVASLTAEFRKMQKAFVLLEAEHAKLKEFVGYTKSAAQLLPKCADEAPVAKQHYSKKIDRSPDSGSDDELAPDVPHRRLI